MKVPNLRSFKPGTPVHVDQTKMLDTEAKESPDTVKAVNTFDEEVTKHPNFGPLGVKGRE